MEQCSRGDCSSLWVPWRPGALVQFWQLHTWGLNIIIGTQTFPSRLVEVRLALWNEVHVSYSTEVWIILRMWWRAYSQTNHILWPIMCYRTMHNEWRGERDGFESDLSPSTSTIQASVFQCRRAAAGFCMLPMSRLQETVPLCFSLYLTSSLSFFLSNSHYNSYSSSLFNMIPLTRSLCLFIYFFGWQASLI